MLTATRVRDKNKRVSATFLETTIDFLAFVLLMAGIFLACLQLFALLASRDEGVFFIGLIPVSYTVLGAVVSWVLFRALAEIIRLLKKIAGVDYMGSISGTIHAGDEYWACSNCAQMLHSETRCDSCGATIVPSNDEQQS